MNTAICLDKFWSKENYLLDSGFDKVYCINAAYAVLHIIERREKNEKSYSYN
ncbi:hypothetical protein [Clostridium sp. BJN0013]|uniref:hypothetical protein n=1 Tax=Clostridium sp. BJN0013 TaxID=3236840 RepID=UPI0034C671CB